MLNTLISCMNPSEIRMKRKSGLNDALSICLDFSIRQISYVYRELFAIMKQNIILDVIYCNIYKAGISHQQVKNKVYLATISNSGFYP